MKRKFILLPITLIALTPAISLVGCGDPDTPEPPEPEESTITIDGIPSETVQGVVGTSGFLNVTIWLNTKDEKTDITNDAEIVFNSSISSSLSYNKQYGQIVWGNDITSGIYNISLTATYDNITSVQYPLILSINSRTPEILLYGTQDSYVSKVNTPGATGKITAMYVDCDKPIMEDITSEVRVNIQSPDLASCGFS
ncbi:MAG: hypothetical protein MJ201_00965 [Mycoplasmoidaceae bacterium]|nr:hypothetical protein [Mycoplasmoidaceae bacterium]